MFSPVQHIKNKMPYGSLCLVIFLAFLGACTPTSTPRSTTSNNTTDDSDTGYPEPKYNLNGTFVQDGATQTLGHFSLPSNFADSFLVRGLALSQFLRTLPNTTRFCVVGRYYIGGDKFLIMSGKPKSYTDTVNKTTEYYLQVEPSNDQANQNDCLTYNLTSSLFNGVTTPAAAFSLSQLCTDCPSSVTSEGLLLYFSNGEQVPTLNLSSLALTISGATSGTGNTCVENTLCSSRGYDCCLDGQCVKDGSVKPGAITADGFQVAQSEVASNPNRFVLYPQFYFVCANRPEDDGDNSSTGPKDPTYEAAIRVLEMNQLYQCLNKVEGEFSYCTNKYMGAAQRILTTGAIFPPAENVFFDDVNFSKLNPYFKPSVPVDQSKDYKNNTIVKIYYGSQTLYDAANKIPLLTADGAFNSIGNDDLTSVQSVLIKKALPANAQDDNLYLTYKVDGTCEKLSASLAKCTKNYIHQYSDTTSTYYHDSGRDYLLPDYADVTATSNLIVKVNGSVVPEEASSWKRVLPNKITFTNNLVQNQTVEITYFAKPEYVGSITKSRSTAQTQINSMCLCATGTNCNLKPIYDTANTSIINYDCAYPSSTSTEPPANQIVYVSGKNVPHRYYDENGLSYDEDYSGALPQAGKAFGYKNSDLLKPTNVDGNASDGDGYTGFNEIYGSFEKSGTLVARPAKLVKVKKDVTYDVFVNSGVYSTCPNCGADYYSSLQKLFPQNFSGMGGGYTPDKLESRRQTNASNYRSDDLLYGRACFVPATMIPWTHKTSSAVKDQRKIRLAGQHFLFANGYNRDWYGFDYGSLIGSFDGVTWFSVGNKRRIKATSGKLFLAVNGYFGDLAVDNNFNVSVSEITAYSPEIADHDTETDGAECQKSHYCSTENDCYRQLGYDYTCQNVGSLTTSWPQFDNNGNEVVGSVSKGLASIVGGNNGQAKRCVYRGRGAPCHQDLNALDGVFNGSSLVGAISCSPTTMCRPHQSGGSSKFNDRISRFANTPAVQNSNSVYPTNTDAAGLGARILGRPLEYYGVKSIQAFSAASLVANGVQAICVPGKNILAATNTYELNSSLMSSTIDSADRMLGIGSTMSGPQSTKYLNACPATDTLGYPIQQYKVNLSDNSINAVTINQNLSTNLLNTDSLIAQNLFSSTGSAVVSGVGYQRNACLRAPGASCFSDMDCAPSAFIASRVKAANLSAIINPAEKKYWEEDLICGNPDFKVDQVDTKKNVCCREIGKTISVVTQTAASTQHWCDDSTPTAGKIKVAGINTPIMSFNRYSRVHTAFDKMTCNRNDISTSTSFALSLVAPDPMERFRQITTQFKTLDTVNQRTCCTTHWVRSFASTNGGGHKWASNKQQNIDKSIFRGLNWLPNNPADPENKFPYECELGKQTSPSCEIRNFSASETDIYLKYFGGLELVGIPQVALTTNDTVIKTNDNVDGSGAIPIANEPPDDTLHPLTYSGLVVNNADFKDSSKNYYSGANYNEIASKLKKVFSEDEFNCCIPSNQQVPAGTTSEQCCTGNVANTGSSTVLRCCLPDYTDLTVYMNRYVSSEGRGLPDSAYDPKTGYIKDPGVVELLASQKNLCCSGKAVRGVAIRKLPIPLEDENFINEPDNANATTRRFVNYSSAIDNNTKFGPIGSVFDAGVRWNDHVYCVPENLPAKIPVEK